MSISICGSVALDTLHTPEGKRDRILGGSAVHASLVACLFSDINIIGIVGQDFPDKYKRLMEKKGISLEGLEESKGNTFYWEGSYLEDLNSAKTLKTELGVLENYMPKLSSKSAESKILFCANSHPLTQLEAIRQSSSDFVALDTMNLWIDIALDDLKKVFSKINILFINEEEARQYVKTNNLYLAGKAILAKNKQMQYVVIKKGEYGSMLMGRDNDQVFMAPAVPLEQVKDPTGAGDSFAGGFLGYLDANANNANTFTWDDLKNAIITGTAVSSFYVEEFGSDNALNITREKVEERIDLLKRYTSI